MYFLYCTHQLWNAHAQVQLAAQLFIFSFCWVSASWLMCLPQLHGLLLKEYSNPLFMWEHPIHWKVCNSVWKLRWSVAFVISQNRDSLTQLINQFSCSRVRTHFWLNIYLKISSEQVTACSDHWFKMVSVAGAFCAWSTVQSKLVWYLFYVLQHNRKS